MEINGFEWHKNEIAPSGSELINRTKRYYEKIPLNCNYQDYLKSPTNLI